MRTLLGLIIATALLVTASKVYPNAPTYVDDVASIIISVGSCNSGGEVSIMITL